MKENDLNIHVQGTLPIASFGHGQLIIFLTLIIFWCGKYLHSILLKKLGS